MCDASAYGPDARFRGARAGNAGAPLRTTGNGTGYSQPGTPTAADPYVDHADVRVPRDGLELSRGWGFPPAWSRNHSGASRPSRDHLQETGNLDNSGMKSALPATGRGVVA
ncbi:hypothetical protein SAMN02745673_01512 [Marinactinospora thermotolerans DSM 45154]|uniref:Uncharacterized protein n=1 Tax=Marinactinospora thermotolerans DSM 45154 TaxID=1122192 RepID=A0A1T4NMQ8_9ACTN|nr:hypothetical protein SAMN02745673_01512 [Marinactinospora thermotolerans DSM 45154]